MKRYISHENEKSRKIIMHQDFLKHIGTVKFPLTIVLENISVPFCHSSL